MTAKAEPFATLTGMREREIRRLITGRTGRTFRKLVEAGQLVKFYSDRHAENRFFWKYNFYDDGAVSRMDASDRRNLHALVEAGILTPYYESLAVTGEGLEVLFSPEKTTVLDWFGVCVRTENSYRAPQAYGPIPSDRMGKVCTWLSAVSKNRTTSWSHAFSNTLGHYFRFDKSLCSVDNQLLIFHEHPETLVPYLTVGRFPRVEEYRPGYRDSWFPTWLSNYNIQDAVGASLADFSAMPDQYRKLAVNFEGLR